MSSTLQNRLVGTIIVVALVVIVVPEFLDGEKRTNKQEFVDIPPVSQKVEMEAIEAFDTDKVSQNVTMPVDFVDEIAVDEAQNEADAASSQNEESTQNNKPANAATKQDKVDKPAARSNSNENTDELANIDVKDSGWVVQLGSFRHEKNVKELLKTLNNAGYRAYSRPVMTSVGELTKVFVGPELDKEKLQLALPHLKEITQLKGKITAFEVSAN